jgi:hypothetical protein
MRFDRQPRVLSPKDVPRLRPYIVACIAFCAISAIALSKELGKPFVPTLLLLLVAGAITQVIFIFVLRPAAGKPALFRIRESDDFETFLTGKRFDLSRLRERYSVGEIVLLVFVIGGLSASFYVLSSAR